MTWTDIRLCSKVWTTTKKIFVLLRCRSHFLNFANRRFQVIYYICQRSGFLIQCEKSHKNRTNKYPVKLNDFTNFRIRFFKRFFEMKYWFQFSVNFQLCYTLILSLIEHQRKRTLQYSFVQKSYCVAGWLQKLARLVITCIVDLPNWLHFSTHTGRPSKFWFKY